jgi:predicted dehydrogenase
VRPRGRAPSLALCRARRLTAAVNFQLRFAPEFLALRDLLRRETLGTVHGRRHDRSVPDALGALAVSRGATPRMNFPSIRSTTSTRCAA